MNDPKLSELIEGLKSGQIIPCLGVNALKECVHKETGEAIPADSDSLILAMNNGQKMPDKLMWEFSRAAMNQELKKGRSYVTNFLDNCYGKDVWTRTAVHNWLAELKPKYLIDINRDMLLQTGYGDAPHNLMLGVARIKGPQYRFKIFYFDGSDYTEIQPEEMDFSLPLLFKPMGSPMPESNYIASDADFVDYLTELRGGFGIPKQLKEYRKGKQYLFIGMRFTRDTQRMILSDLMYGAAEPVTGWILLPEHTPKEQRFCAHLGVEIINADIDDLLRAAGWPVEAQKIPA
jgi:hypothetical protein